MHKWGLSPFSRPGFTLIELLVTIAIIGILAGMVLAALGKARGSAKEYATKATIAKLNAIIMERYESYATRRVPIQIPRTCTPAQAAQLRLYAIRELMQLEMPDSLAEVNVTTPTYLPTEPALHRLYRNATPSNVFESAQCLYLVVSLGSPEAMEQFSQSELGTTSDGHQVFVDGWGNPICWLRWAPGFSSWAGLTPPLPGRPGDSDIQTGDPSADSDPFDPRRINYQLPPNPVKGFHLIPLICSAGADETFGITQLPTASSSSRSAILAPNDPYANLQVGEPDGTGTHHDNITNHHIETR